VIEKIRILSMAKHMPEKSWLINLYVLLSTH
jgi:hypothetical protein